jgi:hypothetical protein
LRGEVKKSLSSKDLLLLNAEDPPTRLFGIGGLYQQMKVEQKRRDNSSELKRINDTARIVRQ